MPVINVEGLIENRVNAIQNYHECFEISRAELDVSGGIDSAVMLMLLSRALGPDKIAAVYSNIHSSIESLRRARDVATKANVNLIELDLTEAYEVMVKNMLESLHEAKYPDIDIQQRMEKDPTILGSFRSCLRAPVGRVLNRMTNGGIRHGTGNEDEDRWLRFYQKGGDGEVDTNPLAMLSKGEVYQLAVALGVPKEIVEAKPTPDLWGTGESHNDEEELSKLSGVDWAYSKVDSETGEYTKIGTIERMSRFLDDYNLKFSHDFFTRYTENSNISRYIIEIAEVDFGLTEKHLRSAIKWEKMTKHKENPNCPTLGTRYFLKNDELITDELSEDLL